MKLHKKITFGLLALTLVGPMTSCSDFLDEELTTQQNTDFFDTQEGIDRLEVSYAADYMSGYEMTGGTTAGAAEMLINCLKPYMKVVLIGQTTKGEYVATETFINPKYPWAVRPVVCEVFNSNGEADYKTHKKAVGKDCFSYFWRSLSKKEADMTQIFHSMIAAILGISEKQIGQTLSLLDDGATIPFISRYRKEMTGGLDEVQIESIRTHYEKLKETAKRKETIVATIREQGKMTPELQKRIDDTWDSTALEDIYLRGLQRAEQGRDPLLPTPAGCGQSHVLLGL